MKSSILFTSRIPAAHWTSRISSRWIQRQRTLLRENRAIYAAHKRYGPIVLLAPGEVSVNSLEGVRTIYGGDMRRTSWFEAFRNYDGTHNLVTMDDRQVHAVRRKMLANIYSKSYLLRSRDFAGAASKVLMERLMPSLITSSHERGGVDVYELMSALFAEWTSLYELGTANGLDLIRPGTDERRKAYCEDGKKQLFQLEGGDDAAVRLEAQCMEMCHDARLQVEAMNNGTGNFKTKEGTGRAPATWPVAFSQLYEQVPSKETTSDASKIMRLIASEVIDHLEAARVGPGIVATYALYEMSKQKGLQVDLRRQLQDAGLKFEYDVCGELGKSTLQALDALPGLDAIVLETLRRYPSAPGPQRREVPEGGVMVEDHFVPGGTTIHVSPYGMHRHEDVFPDPEAWKPERWLNDTASKGALDVRDEDASKVSRHVSPKRCLFHFSAGSKVCLGNNFSIITMKLLLAVVYSNFTTYVVDDDGVEQMDAAMAPPVGDQLTLGFELLHGQST